MDQSNVEIISVKDIGITPIFEQSAGLTRLAKVVVRYYQVTINFHLIKGQKENRKPFFFLSVPYFIYFNKKNNKKMKSNYMNWVDKNVNDQFQLIALQKLSLMNPNYFK